MENQVAELDLARLREIAEKAAPQTWVTWFDMDPRYSNEAMTHIATFNPATVLALLDELEAWKATAQSLEDPTRRDILLEPHKPLLDEIDRLRKWPCRQDLRPGETICHQCHCHVPLLRSFDSASKKFKATCHCGALIWFHDHPPSEGFADDPARSRIEELEKEG